MSARSEKNKRWQEVAGEQMSVDNYVQSHVEIIRTLVDSTATDDELTDNDIISIINGGIIAMRQRTHIIKLAYLKSKRGR